MITTRKTWYRTSLSQILGRYLPSCATSQPVESLPTSSAGKGGFVVIPRRQSRICRTCTPGWLRSGCHTLHGRCFGGYSAPPNAKCYLWSVSPGVCRIRSVPYQMALRRDELVRKYSSHPFNVALPAYRSVDLGWASYPTMPRKLGGFRKQCASSRRPAPWMSGAAPITHPCTILTPKLVIYRSSSPTPSSSSSGAG